MGRANIPHNLHLPSRWERVEKVLEGDRAGVGQTAIIPHTYGMFRLGSFVKHRDRHADIRALSQKRTSKDGPLRNGCPFRLSTDRKKGITLAGRVVYAVQFSGWLALAVETLNAVVHLGMASERVYIPARVLCRKNKPANGTDLSFSLSLSCLYRTSKAMRHTSRGRPTENCTKINVCVRGSEEQCVTITRTESVVRCCSS